MHSRWRGLLLVGLLLLALPATALALLFEESFDITDEFDVDYPQQSMLLVDINRDLNLDLVTVDPNSTVLKIYLGDGTGKFGAGNEVETDGTPIAVTSGDLRGLGRSDLVVASDDSSITILLQGENPLEFTEQVIGGLESEDGFVGIAVLEMSDPPDGRLDIAALGSRTDDNDAAQIAIFLLENLGDGNFNSFASSPLAYGGSEPYAMATGDFNQDGDIDLLIAAQRASGNAGTATPLFQTGNGTFSVRNSLSAGARAGGIVAADFNKDGRSDIAVTDSAADVADNIFLYLANPNGQFTRFTSPDLLVEANPVALAAADFDQNGYLDILSAQGAVGGSSTMGMLFGSADEDLYLGLLPYQLIMPPIQQPRGIQVGVQQAVVTGLINNDSKPDFVVLLENNTASVRINMGEVEPPTPTNTLPTGQPSETPTATPPQASATPTATPTPIPTAPYGLCDLFLDGRPVAVTTGDFDRDSLPDIALADFEGNEVQILFNGPTLYSVANCSSHTAQPDFIAVGVEPRALAAADFGNDGTLELAVATRDGVDILENDGNGTFTRGVTLTVGNDPQSIITVDVNGDGLQDIVVANEGSQSLSVLLGTRAGGFESAMTIPIGRAATSVIAAQLNRDGFMDLAVSSDRVGDVTVLLQNPNSQTLAFRSVGTFASGSAITSLVNGDFNRDGVIDLGVTRPGSGGNGRTQTYDGTILPSGDVAYDATATVDVEAGPSDEGAADFNRDGRLDLVVANAGSDTLTFALGDGNGGFPQTLIPFPVGFVPVALTVVDIDGDGKPDVVVANEGDTAGSGSVSILLSSRPPPTPTPTLTFTPTLTGTPTATGSITQTFTPSMTLTPTITPTPTRTTTGTVTLTPVSSATPTNTRAGGFVAISGPGCQSTPEASSSLVWPALLLVFGLAVRRRGILAIILVLLAPLAVAEAQNLPNYLRCDVALGSPTTRGTVGDFNRDGTPDLAILTANSNTGLVLLTNRDLFAQGSCPEAITTTTFTGGANSVGITTADFDQNGQLDLAVASRDGVTILTNDGAGTFTGSGPLPPPPSPTPGISGATDVAAANLSRDVFPDLIVGGRGSGVTVLINNGNATFRFAQTISVDGPVNRVASADFNLDGRNDIVALGDINAFVFLQQTDGSFAAGDVIAVGGAPIDLGVAVTNASANVFNFNRDDIPDLAFARRDPGEVAAFIGSLSGTQLRFDETSALDAGSPAALAIGDFNGDTTLDVVSSDQGGNLIRFYLGDGQGGLVANNVLPTLPEPSGVMLADVDGDGRLDISTATAGNVISFFLSSDPPPTPTFTATPTGTITSTPLPTDTITATATQTATATPTATPTSTRTTTTTTTVTPSNTQTPTLTPVTAFGLQGTGCTAGAANGSVALSSLALCIWLLARRRAA